MLGSYRTPRVRIGDQVKCEVRGPVVVTAISDSRIQWPWARGEKGRTSPVVYEDLSKALRTETSKDICKAWGIAPCTVWKWRRKLGVPSNTPALIELHRQQMLGAHGRRMHRLAKPTLRSPVRRAKVAAAMRGKKRPPAVVEKMRRRMLGTTVSEPVRRKMSEAHRRRGTRPPKAGKPWTAREDEWLRTLSAAEVAKRTKRTKGAVWSRRRVLGLPDGRKRGAR